MKPEFSIWLLPEASQEALLARTIIDLAEQLGEGSFSPHVTIQGDVCQPQQILSRSVAQLAREFPVQRWRVQGVECGDHFFRCLYLRFGLDAALSAMQDSARLFTGTAEGLSPFPHLSLAYGTVGPHTVRAREGLAATLAGQEVVFDRLALVRSSKNVPLEEWATLEQYPLTGGL